MSDQVLHHRFVYFKVVLQHRQLVCHTLALVRNWLALVWYCCSLALKVSTRADSRYCNDEFSIFFRLNSVYERQGGFDVVATSASIEMQFIIVGVVVSPFQSISAAFTDLRRSPAVLMAGRC